jgi:hypothetical protein
MGQFCASAGERTGGVTEFALSGAMPLLTGTRCVVEAVEEVVVDVDVDVLGDPRRAVAQEARARRPQVRPSALASLHEPWTFAGGAEMAIVKGAKLPLDE